LLAALVSLALLLANPLGSPVLKDITGQLQIGCAFDARVSAPLICRNNIRVGVYLDDTTPNLDYWVTRARELYGYVLVARPPGRWDCPWYGVRCAHEAYLFDCRHHWKLRKAQRYIVQFRYRWPGCSPPSLSQTVSLVLRMLSYRPALILEY
jgi:hypothetical protein